MQMTRRAICLFLICCCVAALAAFPAALTAQQSTMLLPPDYKADGKYPVMVLLPGAGQSASGLAEFFFSGADADMQSGFAQALKQSPATPAFVLVLPPGQASLATGLEKSIAQAEQLIFSDLPLIRAKYAIDTARVAVAGFSLGGDVSFALALRHATRLAGAVVMSSRATYRGKGLIDSLAQKPVRFAFTMGALDERQKEMEKARQTLAQKGVPVQMTLVPEKRHQTPPLTDFLNAVRFVLTP